MGACAILGMTNQDAMSEDMESDPFLNSTLHRFTCELYYRSGSFLAPLSIGLITSMNYLLETIEEQMDTTTLSKYAGLGAAITAELMIGFWFDVGFMLAVEVADS